jgi:hypothetical protein
MGTSITNLSKMRMNKLPKLEKEVCYCLKFVKLGLASSTRAMDPDGEQGSGLHNNIARGESRTQECCRHYDHLCSRATSELRTL